MLYLDKEQLPLINKTIDEDKNSLLNHLVFMPNMAGHQYDDPTMGCPTRIIGDFEIIYFIGGKGFVTIKDTIYECNKGDVILIRPYEEHAIQTSKDEPYDNYWVHFDINPQYMQQNFIESFFPDNCRKINIGVSERLCSLYADMNTELLQKRDGYISIFTNYFSVILLIICRMVKEISTGCQSPSSHHRTKINAESRILEQAEAFIIHNYQSHLSIDDICSAMAVSPSYLFRVFSQYLGMSPIKYMLKMRLKRAEYLMKNSNYSIKEIASKVGFSDAFYFSKTFKKVYGVSPSNYIKSIGY